MTRNTQDLSLLLEQKSIPAKFLSAPAPSEIELQQILQSTMSAPDHGELRPYRFLVIQGDARMQLARVFEQATRQRIADVDEATVEKQKNKPLRSPMIIVVIARIKENPKIPEIEQLLSAGCAAQHIQLASRALGYGSVWLTGDNAYDLTVYEALGLDINERIIGFMYIGTPIGDQPHKARANAADITRHWHRPEHSEFAI